MQRLFTIFIFILCAQSTLIFAQNTLSFRPVSISERQGLSEKFISYSATSTNIESLYESFQEEEATIKVNLNGKELHFILEENGLLADDYFVTVASSEGTTRINDFTVKTYSGVLRDQSGHITITIDKDFFQAMINMGSTTYFIEQAKMFERNSEPGELVLYNEKDVIRHEIFTCAVDDLNQINPDSEDPLEERVNLCRLVDLAIASDASMFTKYGSIGAVTNHNIAVMNNVAFNYRHEFLENIEFQIVTQYVSTAFANDPLTPNTASTDHLIVYPAFSTWGNNGGFGVVYDEAQFWTNRDFNGSTVGYAGTGAICGTNRYHILQDFSTSATDLRSLTAHEMGHNWGAGHDASGAPFIMAPSVNSSNDWSTASKTAVNALIPGYGCLTACTGPISALFTSTPGALCNSGTVNYKDKSINSATRVWTFSGGSPASSTVQQPAVTYSAIGNFTTTLVVNGGSTSTVVNAVIVSAPPPLNTASCALPTNLPGTLGLQDVLLADMFSTSGVGSVDGSTYVDRTCTDIASLQPNTLYNIGIGLGNCGGGPLFEGVRLYIDYNDNGVFDVATETELNPGGGFCGFTTFSFTTSATPVMNQLLRMRIISNINTLGITGPCFNPTNGQVEDFSVIFKSGTLLPVDLISFTGKSATGLNELRWVTKNESYMKRYTVERSYDGEAFSPIGFVTSSNIQTGYNYTFMDNDLSKSNQWYYRLKMEDESGVFKYSNIVFLSQIGDKLTIQKLVTLSTSDRPISFQLVSSKPQPVDIALFDMMGKMQSIYKTHISEGQNNMEFTMNGIPKGMYILRVRNESGEELVNKIFVE